MCWFTMLIGYAKSGRIQNISKIPQLVDKEPSPSHHFCSHSFSDFSWDQTTLQWLGNPPCKNIWKSPWDTQFGWCKKDMHESFPFPCQGKNANLQNLSFRTFEKLLPSFTKTCLYYYTPRWNHRHRQQWKFEIFDLRNIHAKVHITP